MVSDPSSAQVRGGGKKRSSYCIPGYNSPSKPPLHRQHSTICGKLSTARSRRSHTPLRAYEIDSKALKSLVPPDGRFSRIWTIQGIWEAPRGREPCFFFHCPARSAFGREAVFGSVRAFRALRTARGPIPSAPFSNPLTARARSARSDDSEPQASGEARGGLSARRGRPRLRERRRGELGGFPRRLRFSTGVNPDTNLSKFL